MAILTTALAIAQFVPGIARLLLGDKAADVAEQVVGVAKAVAGTQDEAEAIDYIKANPELQLKLQQELNHLVIAQLESDNKDLATINATIQAEYASKDKFVSRWRPFFGYIIALTWLILMWSLGVVIVSDPIKAPAVINSMVNLSGMWGIALAVLGISVHKRSQDKQVAAGQTPSLGVFSALAQRILKSKDAK